MPSTVLTAKTATRSDRPQLPNTLPPTSGAGQAPILRHPELSDGARIWQIAEDSKVLDANSSYAYMLWCRDFASTTIVAEVEGHVAGFVIGYVRPAAPDTFFVWQVAVDHTYRGRGIGVMMLNRLLDDLAGQGVSVLETTVSPDNPGSIAMFASAARRREADMTKHPLFAAGDFPDSHEAEDLYVIAPTASGARTTKEDLR